MSRPLGGTVRWVACALALPAAAPALGFGERIQSPLTPAGYGGPGAVLAVQLDQARFAALRRAERFRVVGFALPDGDSVDLDLERFDVLAPDATLVVAGPGGEVSTARPDVVLLRGGVSGHPDSRTYLALSPLGCNGWLAFDGREFIIAAAGGGPNAAALMYEPALLPAGPAAGPAVPCGVDGLPGGGRIGPLPMSPVGGSQRSATCREVRIAIDTDWQYAQLAAFGGSSAAAQAYAVALIGAVSDIYQHDLNTTLTLGYLRVWSWDGDPYSAETVDQRLDEFRQAWSTTMNGVSRNTAHLLSGLRQGPGGVAYLGALCSGSYGYGVSGYLAGSFPQPLTSNQSGNWDVYVAAHEIGHNFGAIHTHELAPPVDGCGASPQRCRDANQGTIMSYCHTCPGGVANIRLLMHARTISENLLPYLDGLTGCNLVRDEVTITSHPTTRRVSLWMPVSFSVGGSGSGPLSFQWRRNGAPLANDGRITGATSPTLSIAYVLPSDMGAYDAVVSNACSVATSNAAGLSLYSPCPGDADGDGRVSQDDLDYVLTYYGSSVPPGVNGDVDVNGVVNQEDLDLALYYYGCGG